MKKRELLVRNIPTLVVVLLIITMKAGVMGCPWDGRECKDCVQNQMKFDCPKCVPVLRCMARCLWSGSSRSKCVKRCDCGGNPPLSYCKKCMSRCKCSCIAATS